MFDLKKMVKEMEEEVRYLDEVVTVAQRRKAVVALRLERIKKMDELS